MCNMYGIAGIQVKTIYYANELNEFLRIHDGKIVDIRMIDRTFMVIYAD